MYKVVVATNNRNKVEEISQILSDLNVLIIPASDMGITVDVDEIGETLKENALIKARFVYGKLKMPTMADDTGLFVHALGGLPGVRSARFAGENATYEENVRKLLSMMECVNDRRAYFETVIAFIDEKGDEYIFRGRVYGYITKKPLGSGGFGYDPVFMPEGTDRTFAQMTQSEKNEISHRGLALRKFREFLKSRTNNFG